MLKRTLMAAALACLGWNTQAHATLVPTDSTFFTVSQPSTAVFTFLGAEAAHTDEMRLAVNNQLIFVNHTTPIGTTFTTTFQPGVNKLTLFDTATGNTWQSDPALNSDHTAHLSSTANFADFGLGAAPLPVNTAYGWEDLLHGGDRDYNDLVFSLQVTTPTQPESHPVPEPGSLALLGAGLLGIGYFRNRQAATPS